MKARSGVGMVAVLCSAVGCSSGLATAPVLEISIVSPQPGSQYDVGDTIPIVVVPEDPAVTRMTVSFWAEDRLIGVDSVPPYETRWATTEDTPLRPLIKVQASDLPRGTADRSVSVEVNWRYHRPPELGDGWPTATLEEAGLREAPLDSLVRALRAATGHLIHGIVIVRHGELVFEKYFDGLSHPTFGEQPVSYGPETIHGLSSVTKSFTATLLGVAIEKGCIGSVSDRVFDYFPDLEDLDVGLRSEITLEDLVTMRSGLQWDEHTFPLTDERNDLTAWLRRAASTSTDPARDILQRAMVATPGTVYNYAGGDTNVLGNAIQRACSQRLDRYARAVLFNPLGVQDAWWWVFPSDFVYASGDLALRPRDMAKLGQLYLQDGVWNGERILPPGWVEAATASVTSFLPSEGYEGVAGYGYGWWTLTDDYGAGAYEARGWGGQYIVVVPEYDMVVALTAGAYWTPAWWDDDEIMTGFVLPAIVSRTAATPAPASSIDDAGSSG